MMRLNVIYIDVLFLINLYVNYFLLIASRKITGLSGKKLRIFLASLFGAALSVGYFFCDFGLLSGIAIKAGSAGIICTIAFGYKPLSRLLKATFGFFGISILFAGIMFAIVILFSPSWMISRSGVVYFNISAVALAIFTLVSYGLISLYDFVAAKKSSPHDIYYVTVKVEREEATFRGLMDSGNTLADTFSGNPVLVCQFESIKKIIPHLLHGVFSGTGQEDIELLRDTKWYSRYRVLPFNSLGGKGLLPGFKADKIILTKNGKSFSADNSLIAVYEKELSGGEYEAIFNPRLLTEISERGAG